MAIDKNKAKNLIDDTNKLFEKVSRTLPRETRTFIEEKIMEPILDDLNKLVMESRPPVIFIVGRSGHGKSSLLNALANKKVAEVGDIKPTTAGSTAYEISFEDKYASWSVVDTRGIFESTTPEGALEEDAVEILKKDIVKYRPDIIIHLVSAPEIRNISNDLKVFDELLFRLEEEIGSSARTILVMNKVDTLGNPRDWPPEHSSKKMGLIREAVSYMTKEILAAQELRQLDISTSARGYRIYNSNYLGVVPVSSLENDLWNIETLSDFIGENLPDEALIDFYQAQGRKEQLMRLSSRVIDKFTKIAGTIALSPVPISDIFILTPLQFLMISIIGGLSCREFKKETAHEYLGAIGLNLGVAFGLRSIAQQIVKLIPMGGSISSSAIAASGTYGIGKSAETYFFSGEIKKPKEYEREWEEKGN